DYVADGTSDEDEINSALTAASGGKVLLLAGTYDVDAQIAVPSNTTLSGVGTGSVITVGNSASGFNIIENSDQVSGNSDITVRDLKIDGNKTGGASNIGGIEFDTVGSGVGTAAINGFTITNVTIDDVGSDAIEADTSFNSLIENSFIFDIGGEGVDLTASDRITVSGNQFFAVQIDAIFLYGSDNNLIQNNLIEGVIGPIDHAILLSNGSRYNTIDGNTIINTGGYGVVASGAQYNIISNNSIKDSDLAGVRLNASYHNTVTGNSLHNNDAYDSGETASIEIEGNSDDNVVVGNFIREDSADGSYAISIMTATAEDNYLADNLFTNTAGINDQGTDNIYGGQLNASNDFVIQPAGDINLVATTIDIDGNLEVSGTSTLAGQAIFTGVATDITTGTDEDLTVVANGTGVIYLNDTVQLGTLPGDADTDSLLCLNAAGQIDSCQNATLDGEAFVNGGNTFGGTATLGTNELQDLVFRTDSTTRLTIQGDGTIDLGSGGAQFNVASNTEFTGGVAVSNDSTNAFYVQNGGTRALTVDTTNRTVGIGVNSVDTGYTLQVGGDTKIDGVLVEQYLEFTPTATETGWYRIITTGNSSHSGRILVEADHDNKIQSLEFTYSGRRYSGGDEIGTVTVLRNLSYNNGPVTQVRVGRNTDADESVLDIYVNSATTPGVIRVYGYGPEVTLDSSATYEPDFAAGAETESSTAKVVDALGTNSGLGIATTGNFRGEGLEIGYTGSTAIDVGDTSSYLASFQQGTASASLFVGSNASGGVFLQSSSGDDLQINNQGGNVQLNANGGRVSIGEEFVGGAKLRVDTDDGENYIGLIVTQHDTTNNNVALQVDNTGSGNSFQVNTTDFVVAGNGNVGIGAAPDTDYKLDIQGVGSGSSAQDARLRLQRSDDNGLSTIEFSGAGAASAGDPWYQLGLDSSASFFTLYVDDGASGYDSLRVETDGDVSLGDGSLFVDYSNGRVGLGTSGPSYDLSFSGDANKTIKVETTGTNAAGYNLVIGAGNAGAGGSAFAGGELQLQGGSAAGTGNANGGDVVLSGGAGTGTGVQGLVVVNTTAFDAAAVQNFTGSANITQSNIDSYGTILISSNASGYEATLTDPTNTTTGRVVYVTNVGSYDMTLVVNAGGTGNEVTLKPSTTATMVWNGTDWTAAGASSSTDLQAAYDNTATSAGGAEIVLASPGGSADGLTIRNNDTTPIVGGILEVQSSIGTNLFSVNNLAPEFASNGGAENSSSFTSDWSDHGSAVVSRYVGSSSNIATGLASVEVLTFGANSGVENSLSSNPLTNTTYQVSFTGTSSSGSFSTLEVLYSRDGGSNTVSCGNYSGTTLVTTGFTKITCTFTTDATTATDPIVIVRHTDGTSRQFYIDNLSVVENDTTSEPDHVQIGGGINGGPVTLFTLDRSSAPPVADGNEAYLGSMYYDTVTGRIQCYEADGWGACGSPPNNVITLTPEYAGAVLNGNGVGTMTADFCGNGGGVSVNTSFCASGEARNYYEWTSPQATDQTYSIYITFQLPETFDSFLTNDTITLEARSTDHTVADVTYELFRSTDSAITECGSDTTVTTASDTWQVVAHAANENSCSFAGGDRLIFKLNMIASDNEAVYVSDINFTYTND
ncbi:TPA: hypothetical protein EYN47_02270, partial [Candidatus Saccharibacteria bacterium]|nr:hypothetical protein [Candidatus Saccharibacteria bacterium]